MTRPLTIYFTETLELSRMIGRLEYLLEKESPAAYRAIKPEIDELFNSQAKRIKDAAKVQE